jgi:hypothetical protein
MLQLSIQLFFSVLTFMVWALCAGAVFTAIGSASSRVLRRPLMWKTGYSTALTAQGISSGV